MSLKLVFCCHRSPELSLEEFHRSWLEDHGPLVTKLRHLLPTMQRYVQSHTVPGPMSEATRESRGAKGEVFDGITEVWMDLDASPYPDAEAAADAMRQLLEDEKRLLDLPRCSIFVTEEHVIF